LKSLLRCPGRAVKPSNGMLENLEAKAEEEPSFGLPSGEDEEEETEEENGEYENGVVEEDESDEDVCAALPSKGRDDDVFASIREHKITHNLQDCGFLAILWELERNKLLSKCPRDICNTRLQRIGNDTNRFRRFTHLDPGTFLLARNLEVPFIRCGRHIELGHLDMILLQSG